MGRCIQCELELWVLVLSPMTAHGIRVPVGIQEMGFFDIGLYSDDVASVWLQYGFSLATVLLQYKWN